jgi:hypothetical protein
MANTVLGSTFTINSTASSWPSYGNVTISTTGAQGSSGSYLYSTGSSYNWGNVTSSNVTGNGLHVSSNAVIDGDLTVQGVSIVKTLEKINERLAILVPDPKKLEKYKALKKAYDNYKTLEALIQEDDMKD